MKQLFNSGKPPQDATDPKTFNIFQDIAGANTLPNNPTNPTPTPLGAQEGVQMETAQKTQLGSTTEIDPATGAAKTINTIQNT
jgi:hypothetical protein